MKKNAISSLCWRCVLAIAITLGTYHSLYGLIDRHYIIPLRFHYGEFALIALYAVVVITATASSLLNRKTCPQFLTAAGCYKTWFAALPFVFFVVIFISSLLLEPERPGSFLYSIGCLADTGILFFVLFPLGLWFGFRKDLRLLHSLIGLISGIYLVLILYALYGIHFGQEACIGGVLVEIKYGRLWVGAVNPNDTGMFCVLMIAVGLYRMISGTKFHRILYGFAIIVFYVCLILTDSRGALLAVSLGVGGYAGTYWWHRCENKNRLVPLLSAAVVCGFVAGAMFLCRYAVKLFRPFTAVVLLLMLLVLLWHCRKLVTSRLLLCAGAAAVLAAVVLGICYGPTIMDMLAFDSSRSGGSGRLQMWGIVIDLLRDNRDYFLRGCGPLYISEKIAPLYGTSYTTHNQFLEIALGYGVPAMVIFMAWLVGLARYAWQIIKAPLHSEGRGQKFLPFILLILLTNNMFENCLLFYRFVTGSVFFLVAGYVCSTKTFAASGDMDSKNLLG